MAMTDQATVDRDAELRQALEQTCPICAVQPGKRCVTRKRTVDAPGYPPPRNVAETRKYPHPERIAVGRNAELRDLARDLLFVSRLWAARGLLGLADRLEAAADSARRAIGDDQEPPPAIKGQMTIEEQAAS
jgi:hypothetical protein